MKIYHGFLPSLSQSARFALSQAALFLFAVSLCFPPFSVAGPDQYRNPRSGAGKSNYPEFVEDTSLDTYRVLVPPKSDYSNTSLVGCTVGGVVGVCVGGVTGAFVAWELLGEALTKVDASGPHAHVAGFIPFLGLLIVESLGVIIGAKAGKKCYHAFANKITKKSYDLNR